MLSDLGRQVTRFTQEIDRAKTNNDVSQAALDDALAQSRVRDDIILKLDQDRQNMENDLETITQLFNDRTAQYEGLQKRSRQLDQLIQRQYEAIRGAAAVLRQVSDTE